MSKLLFLCALALTQRRSEAYGLLLALGTLGRAVAQPLLMFCVACWVLWGGQVWRRHRGRIPTCHSRCVGA